MKFLRSLLRKFLAHIFLVFDPRLAEHRYYLQLKLTRLLPLNYCLALTLGTKSSNHLGQRYLKNKHVNGRTLRRVINDGR